MKSSKPKVDRTHKPRMRLYVWHGFAPDYTGGLAVALATSEAAARRQIVRYYGCHITNWGRLKIFPLGRSMAVAVAGGG